jgi:hypothetical protein
MASSVSRAGQAFLHMGEEALTVMSGSGFKAGIVGGIVGAVIATSAVALAGSGVGGVFSLGVSNSVDAKTTLAGASPGIQLEVKNTNAAGRNGLAVTSANSYPTGAFTNTGGGPAGAFVANAGAAPFTVSSTTKVGNLNADRLDGLDSSAFLTAGTKAKDADMLDGLDSNSFTQGFASRVSYVKRTLVSAPGTEVTLLDLGWAKLIAYCVPSQLSVGFSHPGTDPIEVGRLEPPTYYTEVNGGTIIDFDVLGGVNILQSGQNYRPAGGGFPRTRMATFVISGAGDNGQGCRVQVQELAQGF